VKKSRKSQHQREANQQPQAAPKTRPNQQQVGDDFLSKLILFLRNLNIICVVYIAEQ